jgi:hypothetical protein
MEKITVKELFEFNQLSSDEVKNNFANKLKTRPAKQKKSDDKDGGLNETTLKYCLVLGKFSFNFLHRFRILHCMSSGTICQI